MSCAVQGRIYKRSFANLGEKAMIARTWHGAVPADKAADYYEYLTATGVPDYRKTAGNRGVMVLRRTDGDVTHFLLVTFWDSLYAIEAFAGKDIDRARYYPEDSEYLLELEPHVTHYDVLESSIGSE